MGSNFVFDKGDSALDPELKWDAVTVAETEKSLIGKMSVEQLEFIKAWSVTFIRKYGVMKESEIAEIEKKPLVEQTVYFKEKWDKYYEEHRQELAKDFEKMGG